MLPDRVRETLHAVRARARWRHALLAAASAGAAWALGVVIGRVALGWASGPALVLAALAGVVVGAFAWFSPFAMLTGAALVASILLPVVVAGTFHLLASRNQARDVNYIAMDTRLFPPAFRLRPAILWCR